MDIVRHLLLLAVPLLVASCANDYGPDYDSLPHARVQLELDLLGEDQKLQVPMTLYAVDHVKYQGEYLGHGGIIVVHTHSDEFFAYDMACPYDFPVMAPVVPLYDSRLPLGVVCPRCGSVYDLADGWGTPVDGPARQPLQAYRVRVYDDGILEVSN